MGGPHVDRPAERLELAQVGGVEALERAAEPRARAGRDDRGVRVDRLDDVVGALGQLRHLLRACRWRR